jgi:hypothetical protein
MLLHEDWKESARILGLVRSERILCKNEVQERFLRTYGLKWMLSPDGGWLLYLLGGCSLEDLFIYIVEFLGQFM